MSGYNFRRMRGPDPGTNLMLMTSSDPPKAARRFAEPLFTHNAPLWVRVWVATQGVALVIASTMMLVNAGGPGALAGAHRLTLALAVVGALVVYHVLGVRYRAWIVERSWAVAVFVPLGWLLVLGSLRLGGAFSLLILGAIIQGFIFLSLRAAIATLGGVVVLLVFGALGPDPARWTSVVVARAVGVVATGIMIATVMLYIDRVNRDAAIRARLLDQLDAAQRDLADRAREAGVLEERQRLARDIHDTLAQGFTSVIKHLEAAELSAARLPVGGSYADDSAWQAALPHLEHARHVSRDSLAEIRRLVWALRPAPLADATLGAALERIVAQWAEANGVTATCAIGDVPPLHPDADVIFLRATQEALSNVSRHAAAKSITVSLTREGELMLLSIDDDGRGFLETEQAERGRMGLSGMRERVRPFGGRVLVESAPGKGTSLTIALPLATVAGRTA